MLWFAMVVASAQAEAQQARKVPRVGVIGSVSAQPLYAEFLQGLRDLGYVEGQSIAIEWRDPKGNLKRVPEFAAELAKLKVDIIVAPSSTYASAARKATSTIPIVTMSADPIAAGLVSNLGRPGGNVTGLSTQSSDVIGKQLELLKQTVPRFTRVAILQNPEVSFHRVQLREAEAAARSLGAEPRAFPARTAADLDQAFADLADAQVDALLILVDGTMFLPNRARIADLAAKRGIPAMHPRREHVEAGGLISYGTDRRDHFRRLSVFVDKILKGAKPGDLPIEQPTRFELVINLKAARALNLTIPQSVLHRADDVIK